MTAPAALLLVLALSSQDKPAELVLRGGRLERGAGAPEGGGLILVAGGMIRSVGPEGEAPPSGALLIEVAKTAVITPGFVDLHSHLGSAFDVEESTEAVTPEMKAVEAFTSRHPDVLAALSSGVTTVAIAPGNGNLVGGKIGLVKVNGLRYDRALYRDAVALKVSLGREALRRDREPTSLMGAAAKLRELLGGQNGGLPSLPLFIHASTSDEIESVLALRAVFPREIVLVHAKGAGEMAERLAAAGVPVAFGPLTVDDPKEVLEAPGKLARAGVRLAFVSDAPWTALEHLRTTAALAMKYGLPREAALQALFVTPAELLGLGKRLGTLEPGKEADLVVWSGDPLSLFSSVEFVVVGGKITYRKDPER
jgi:imidazolonepropionase-like amidohydrolase